ncbi:hypothetical protein FHS96_000604 [Sphingomonas zeicaulis]|uniref:M14 family zinc carboxypeptidase n=1 Tax=Sphingomonas zeicaulis TaxID=1632740 RepID=UPI003D1C1603
MRGSKRGLVFSTTAMIGAMAAVLAAAPAAAQPTPKEVLGHDVGEDYYLATYEDSVNYFHKLATSTDKMKMVTAGKTTQGRTYEYAIISSPENLAKWDATVAAHKRLATADGLDDAAAKALAKESLIIVHIDGGLHAAEVSAHQSAMALAYKLVASPNDEEVQKILKNVIVVLWPTLNPDGMTMVVDWYRKQRGTQWETSSMPWLYQEYVGHDNNRDGYMLNMIESQNVFKAEQSYSPTIWYTHHQVAPFPARIWVPPFSDPMSSNISPYMRSWTTSIGVNMMNAFEERQMPGAIAQARFDNWYPGFLDYTHVFRHTISFFTEVAHSSATPKYYDPKKFPKNMQDMKAQVMYPSPWKGGWWHFADSIKYETVASMSVLDTAVRYRDVLLYNRYQAARDTIKKGASGEGPYAWVIPGGQADAPEAASLAQKLIQQGVIVNRANAPVTLGGKTYPAGSWVIRMDQPYAGLVQELFERQKYPDAILGGDGKPVDLPYDVTGWTLPLQFGVAAEPVTAKPAADAYAALTPVAEAKEQGGVTGSGSTFLLSRKVNASFLAANEAAKRGAKISLTPDTIVLSGLGADAMGTIATSTGATATAATTAPQAIAVKAARVGLYRPWGSNMDEGWTRWLLEQYQYGASSIRNEDMKKGGLSAKYDVIILPDLRGRDSLLNGLKPEDAPAGYTGGIGEEGAIALKKFVADGGTLVTFNNAADAAIDLFALPVTNIVKNARSDEFFCSGALLQVKLATPSRATAGMPADPVVMFEKGPVFQPARGFKGNVLASYPTEGSPLLSGVLLHGEKIRGRAAALEVEYGKGRVFLYGFRPQWRGQTHGTYKMLFNLLFAYPDQEASTLKVTEEAGYR